jgi:hypothetical protein
VVFTNGEFDDWIVYPDVLDQDLADWSKNELRYVGELLDESRHSPTSSTRLIR